MAAAVAARALSDATLATPMTARAPRQAYLRAIGIDAWLERGTGWQRAPASLPALQATATIAADAASVGDWDRLCSEVSSCQKCGLHAGRTQTVFGVGARRARWLIVGEAPGAEEDRRGEPFVGRAGKLLDSMLRAIGLSRETVFIANVLKCRPPGNRDPKPEEVTECLPYLHRQIALIQPQVILAVGRIAAQNLLGTDAPLGRLRGRVYSFGTRPTPLIVTYHPAYLLRAPAEKRKAWADLKFAQATLQATADAGGRVAEQS